MNYLIKPDGFLYGLIHSDLDNYLLYRYDELIIELYKTFESLKNEQGTAEVFDLFTNMLKTKITESKRKIRSLDLYLKAEIIPINEISLNQIRKNNLVSINEKTECLINDLNIIRKQLGLKENYNKKISKKTTYQWQTNPDEELPKLFNLMINKYKLLASDTSKEQFKAVFTGQPVESINPMKWNPAKNLLAYFINSLYDKKKLYEIINPDKWDVAKDCFLDCKNLSQLSDLYKNNKTGLPKNSKIIDELLNAL